MKILLRSAMPIDHVPSISEILNNNYIGSNIGNILFQNSMTRWILTEDNEITRIDINREFTNAEIDYYNQNFDMLVLPLANALRKDFMPYLKYITSFVKRLEIPCVVVGMGIQRELNDNSWNFDFNDVAKDFFKEILNKSNIVGVRGEITADYLKHLGLVPEKDFTVIGCPSLYTFGYNLPAPNVKELTPASPISFNSTMMNSLWVFLEKEAKKFENYDYICTVLNELRTLYAGFPYPKKDLETFIPPTYPVHFDHPLIKENRIVSFVDEQSWINFLKTKDFSFGCRIHGSIANLLVGTPVYVFLRDCRVKELVEYHNIPHMDPRDITDSTNIFDLHEKTDFTQILNGHKERVDYFVDFLDRNSVPHYSIEAMHGETLFDKLTNIPHAKGEIRHFVNQDPVEQERRLREYYLEMAQGKQQAMKKVKKLESEKNKLNKKIKSYEHSKFYKMQKKYHSIKDKFM